MYSTTTQVSLSKCTQNLHFLSYYTKLITKKNVLLMTGHQHHNHHILMIISLFILLKKHIKLMHTPSIIIHTIIQTRVNVLKALRKIFFCSLKKFLWKRFLSTHADWIWHKCWHVFNSLHCHLLCICGKSKQNFFEILPNHF